MITSHNTERKIYGLNRLRAADGSDRLIAAGDGTNRRRLPKRPIGGG
ncbi:MAG: hypothetical protein V2I33_21525 [Kangiellaceae bacterium]|nr:hypothetical protein [Kangiellaceae bacterium]